MKQKDIAIIAVAVIVSIVISIFVSKAIFPSSTKPQQADTVQAITADFPQPDKNYFNSQSFDPSQTITIGQNNNSNPFSGSSSTQ